ncbi:RapZ C-terminal domain-containing protein [Ornithobacterium rhinotracheale]
MNKLNINVRSFSYREEIPQDPSGNGGGFVFDCRGILNPGRIDEYKKQTGRDQGVKDFLLTKTEMPKFIELIQNLIDITVKDYIARGFTNLEINFGCTGGQHRSVFAADSISDYLRENYPDDVDVKTAHTVQDAKNWQNG